MNSVNPTESERWLHDVADGIKRECGSDMFHAIEEELNERRYTEGNYGD